MDALKHGLELAFSPLGIMTLLMAGGVVLAVVRRKSRWGRRLLVAGALLFLSRTPYANLAEARRMVGIEPFILVTPAADLRRAMAGARRLGMKPVAAPACIWALQRYPADMPWGALILAGLEGFAYPSPTRWRYLQWAYHEYLGYLFYTILGRV